MKQSLDTRTKLLTKNPISLMIELSIPADGSCIGIISIYFDKCRFCRNAGRWFRFGTFTSDW